MAAPAAGGVATAESIKKRTATEASLSDDAEPTAKEAKADDDDTTFVPEMRLICRQCGERTPTHTTPEQKWCQSCADYHTNTSTLLVTPAELSRVVEFCIRKATLVQPWNTEAASILHQQAKERFLPDVEKYRGKFYVTIDIELNGGELHAGFVTTDTEWDKIEKGTKHSAFELGDVAGKYSDVKIGYSDHYWNTRITRDPYDIAKLVATHGEDTPEWIERYLEKYNEQA
jgi:hypothetical protein